MTSVLLIIHLFVTLALIGVVLIQRSEGGGLGVGTSQGMGSFMSGRGTANLLTRTTAILAAVFFSLSLVLALLNRGTTVRHSILDVPAPASSPVVRQRGERIERAQHLRGRSLEQAPAAAAEQRVAAEDGAVARVGDVASGVARDVEHAELEPEREQCDAIAALDRDRAAGDVLAGRAVDRHAVARGERLDASGVVSMVVGHEDRGERELVRVQDGFDRRRVARVDDGDARGRVALAVDQPEVVVFERRNAGHGEAGRWTGGGGRLRSHAL